MAPVLQHYFLVDDPLQTLLTKLIEGVQRTPSWERMRYSCFVMAGFVQLALEAHGHHVHILPCTGVAMYQQQIFKLGFPGFKKSDAELDGHVACVIDSKIIVDFGLGNVRRYGFPNFPMALAADCKKVPIYPVTLKIGDEIQFQWNTEALRPEIETTVTEHQAYAQRLYQEYLALPDQP